MLGASVHRIYKFISMCSQPNSCDVYVQGKAARNPTPVTSPYNGLIIGLPISYGSGEKVNSIV